LAAVAALALIAGASFASAADPADAANAKQRFLAGAQLYSQGKFSDAVDQFLAADRIGPSAALSFDIARSYEKLGETSLTLRWYRDYLHRAGNPADAAKVHRTIVSLEHELQNKGVQQITVRSIPRGATVAIDGEPAGVTPMTTDLPPGRHRLTMTHDGYEKAERLFNLAPDEAQDIDTRLAQAAPAAAAPAVPAPVPGEPPPDSAAQAPPSAPYTAPAPRSQAASPTMRTLGIIGMSVGGAALGTSLAFEILRRDSVNDAKNDPTQVGYASKLNAANDRQTASRVLLGVGAGLAVTGGVLFFVGARGTHSTEIALGCSPALCGARAFGRF
jgi:tetratricopeptide (TPR) repeat protein